MDLVSGARSVLVMMTHTTREGGPKLLDECTLPLTGKACIDMVITDLGVMRITGEGLVLEEIAPGVSLDDVRSATGTELLMPREPLAIAV